MQAMEPGSMKGLQLVVADAYAAREELRSRGVDASEITTFDERDGGTFFGFADPDGNTWAVQQIKARAEKPLIRQSRAVGSAKSVVEPKFLCGWRRSGACLSSQGDAERRLLGR